MKTSGGRGPRASRPTMTDVARRAGVSQSSVSLVLNDMPGSRISAATRQRVLDAAQALGYRLGQRQTERGSAQAGVIAYLVDEISTSPHPVVTIDGARDAAWEAGCVVSVYATRANAEIETATLEALRQHRSLVGVIYSTIFTRQVEPPPALRNFPTVLLNCYAADRSVTSVVPGEAAGGFTATEFLLSQGHCRIGLINGEPWMDASRDRLKGYRQALAAAGIAVDPSLVTHGDWMPDAGYHQTFALLRAPQPPTAIFCANDLMALGALEALAELGIRVPDEISVMGYDDQELARYTRPPLSTCILPNYEMGRWAAEALIERRTADRSGRPLQIKMECPLVRRQSVAAPHRNLDRVIARVADRLALAAPVHPIQPAVPRLRFRPGTAADGINMERGDPSRTDRVAT